MTNETHLPREQLLINLERAGAAMANCMYNWAQRDGLIYTTHVVAKMDEMRRDWDAAAKALRSAPAPALAGDAPKNEDTLRLLFGAMCQLPQGQIRDELKTLLRHCGTDRIPPELVVASDALLDAVKPFIDAIDENDSDTLGLATPDRSICFVGESHGGTKVVTLGDLRKLKIAVSSRAAAPLPVAPQKQIVTPYADAMNFARFVYADIPQAMECLDYLQAVIDNPPTEHVKAAPLPVAQDATPYGWQQHIDGVKTQNFARDEKELADIKSVFRLMKHPGKDTYLPLFTQAAAVPVVAQDARAEPWRKVVADLVRVLRSVQQGEDENWQCITNVCLNADELLAGRPASPSVAQPSTLPPLPELEGAPDIDYLKGADPEWDADYLAMWTKVQVLSRNVMQWRKHALEVRALFGAPSVAVAQDAQIELYQYRTRADWHKNWQDWTTCSRGSYEGYIKTPLLHDWHYEVRALAVVPPSLPAVAPHADDIAVDAFAAAMKAKMATQRAKGYYGWDSKQQCSDELLAKKLMDHTKKGDPVDVANFAMMLHQRHGGDTYIVGNVLRIAALDFAKRVASMFIPEAAVAPQEQKTAWLIELFSDGASRGYWSGNSDRASKYGWTSDHDKAIKFLTKVDADNARLHLGFVSNNKTTTHLSTEHVWMIAQAPAAPQQPEAERAEAKSDQIPQNRTWKHAANEWADTAYAGLQWLRNIEDGTTKSVQEARENMESCCHHAKSVADGAMSERAPVASELSGKQIEDMIFNFAPDYPIGQGKILASAILAATRKGA